MVSRTGRLTSAIGELMSGSVGETCKRTPKNGLGTWEDLRWQKRPGVCCTEVDVGREGPMSACPPSNVTFRRNDGRK